MSFPPFSRLPRHLWLCLLPIFTFPGDPAQCWPSHGQPGGSGCKPTTNSLTSPPPTNQGGLPACQVNFQRRVHVKEWQGEPGIWVNLYSEDSWACEMIKVGHGQSNWGGYHISVNSASARKTKEGRSSKCLGLEGGSSTKFCTRQLPWRLLSYFGLYCFVSASFFGDNFTLDDLTSDYYSFWNCPGGLSYDCFAPPQHNLKEHHKYFHQIHFCVIPISINQSIIIAWSIPYCHCLNIGSLILYYWC